MLKGFSRLVLLLGFLSAWSAQAMNLQEYLKNVGERHRSLKAYDAQKEAADFREQAGDIELVPTLSAGASYTDDKNPLGQFAFFGATQTKVTEYDLGVQKKFSSGTTVGLSAQAIDYQNYGPLAPGLAQYANFAAGSLGVSLSQSLWKNFFGHGTRLRWERQDAATRAEKGNYDLQAQNLLVNAEAAFWDYLYALENLAISRDSLERSKRIESWTRRRVSDGISEKADLYQAQALVTSRQLLLIAVEDDLAAARQTLRDYLELGSSENLPDMQGDLSQTRSISSMVNGSGGKVMQLQAYLSTLDAKAKFIYSKEVEDAYRPDLVLSGLYQTHSVEGSTADAINQWSSTKLPTQRVALNFTYMFDTSVKDAARDASKRDATAAKLFSERKILESDSSWIELNRRYVEMTKRIEAATQTAKLQDDRAKAEAALFNRGRSITNNVVNAEEDAGVAKLNVARLKSEQRKMEAQGRLYVAVEENK